MKRVYAWLVTPAGALFLVVAVGVAALLTLWLWREHRESGRCNGQHDLVVVDPDGNPRCMRGIR